MAIEIPGAPSSILVPGFYAAFRPSGVVVNAPLQRILLIGQALPGVGTGEVVQIINPEDGAEAFGRGSMLANMCRACRSNNTLVPIDAIAVAPDTGGVAQVQTHTIAGTPTEAGVYTLKVGDTRYSAAVALDSTPTSIATDLLARINEDADREFTATAAAGVITGTARHTGVPGFGRFSNRTRIDDPRLPAGVTGASAIGTAGAANPDVGDALAAIGESVYSTYVPVYSDSANQEAVRDLLEDRWGPLSDNGDGIALWCLNGTVGEASARVQANHQNVVLMAMNETPTPEHISAAILAAQEAEVRTASPRTNVTIPGVASPAPGRSTFNFTQNQTLLALGLSPVEYVAGLAVTVDMVTTDVTERGYRKLRNIRILSAMRREVADVIQQTYPDASLGDDETVADESARIATPKSVAGIIDILADSWELKGWLTSSASFAERRRVVRDPQDPERLQMLLPVNLTSAYDRTGALIAFSV